MVEKRIINNINENIPSANTYKNIETKLDFNGFQAGNIPKTKKPLKFILPISAICTAVVVAAIVIPVTLNKQNSQTALKPVSSLLLFDDKNTITALASSGSEAIIMPTPSLDQVYSDYTAFKNSEDNNMSFFYETRLSLDSFYNCFYMPKSTIERIDKMVKEKTIPDYSYSSYESSSPSNNYFRSYLYLFNHDMLFEDDNIYVSFMEKENDFIYACVDDCVLVKITRNLNIDNKDLGYFYFDDIKYEINEQKAYISKKSFYEKYDNKIIVSFNTPYLKSISNKAIFEASFLDIFSYLIDEENNTFETFIYYDWYFLNKDEHYYDNINNIISGKDYIRTSTYTDHDNISHTLDAYAVTCDYSKAKVLFDLK